MLSMGVFSVEDMHPSDAQKTPDVFFRIYPELQMISFGLA
jgi:hypothetical protein